MVVDISNRERKVSNESFRKAKEYFDDLRTVRPGLRYKTSETSREESMKKAREYFDNLRKITPGL